MGILDAIRGKADALDKSVNPLRKVGDAIDTAVGTASADPTGLKAATSAGKTAHEEAVSRGKDIPVTTVMDSKVREVK